MKTFHFVLFSLLFEQGTGFDTLPYITAKQIATTADYASIATNSIHRKTVGFPYASLIEITTHKDHPVFCFSDLSIHARNLKRNAASSICICQPDFRGLVDSRVSFIGNITPVTNSSEIEIIQDIYRRHHPDAFWIDFEDFRFYEMDKIHSINFNGGFGKAIPLSVKRYLETTVN